MRGYRTHKRTHTHTVTYADRHINTHATCNKLEKTLSTVCDKCRVISNGADQPRKRDSNGSTSP